MKNSLLFRHVFFLFFLSFFLFNIPIFANSFYPFETKKQAAQFDYLLKDLRCLVCQNQNLADSGAGLAEDLRKQVYEMVKASKSDEEIIRYLTDRYGDFILFKPPVKPLTFILWFGPAFFLLIGFIIFWRTCKERSHA